MKIYMVWAYGNTPEDTEVFTDYKNAMTYAKTLTDEKLTDKKKCSQTYADGDTITTWKLLFDTVCIRETVIDRE